MKTLIYKTKEEFDKRKKKNENGVSEEFAIMHPSFEKENITNKGCWNCMDCHCCVESSYCNNCYHVFMSTYCRYSAWLRFSNYCDRTFHSTNSEYCEDCFHCICCKKCVRCCYCNECDGHEDVVRCTQCYDNKYGHLYEEQKEEPNGV